MPNQNGQTYDSAFYISPAPTSGLAVKQTKGPGASLLRGYLFYGMSVVVRMQVAGHKSKIDQISHIDGIELAEKRSLDLADAFAVGMPEREPDLVLGVAFADQVQHAALLLRERGRRQRPQL